MVSFYNFSLIFIIALFLVFVDLFEGNLNSYKLIFSSAAVGASAIYSLLAIIQDHSILFTIIQLNEFQSFNWNEIFSLIFDSFILIVGIISYRDLTHVINSSVSETQRKQVNKMRIGVIFIFFIPTILEGASIYLINEPTTESYGVLLRFIISALIIGIGMIYIGNAYSSSNQISLLQPQKMDYLLVINSAGLPLFDYKFRQSELNQESMLISGAIQAITILMREAFGVSSNITMIKFEDKEILVKIQKEVAFLLITEKSSYFLSKSLVTFSYRFIEEFKDYLDVFNGDTTIFSKSIEIISNLFGFPIDN